MRRISFFFIPLIIVTFSCKNDTFNNQYPSLCIIQQNPADLDQIWDSINIALIGLEYNPESYFYIRGTSMGGSRIFLASKCSNQTFKQYVFIPNEPGTIWNIAVTGKSELRFFTSKEIAEVEVWEKLSEDFIQLVTDPEPVYDHTIGHQSYIIKYNLFGDENFYEFLDSIPVNYIKFLNSITGFNRNGMSCNEICEKYFGIDY